MVKSGESGSSEKVDLELFHLNHILYTRAFVISDIYASILPSEMAVVTKSVKTNLSKGRLTRFIITTEQKVPYQLTVAVFEDKGNDEKGLVILTNFNPEKGKFEKKAKENHYATWCPLSGEVVQGSMFQLPMEDEEEFLEKEDYISLIFLHVFNTQCDTAEINNWFALAEEKQPDKINNRNFLKSYFHLSQYNFDESEVWLEELKKSVATFPVVEQNHWAPMMKNLAIEIMTLRKIKED